MHLSLLTDPRAFDELTVLLHAAYAPLAARGLRFAATHQSVDVTRRRAERGECWVGREGDRIVATVTVTPPGRPEGGGFYARTDLAKFGQMAVDPAYQGRGFGARLIDHAEARARALGAAELACDTSVHALELQQLYYRKGFRFVGYCDWRPFVNYLSVMVSKDLVGGAPASLARGWKRAPDNAWPDRAAQVWAVFSQVWPTLPAKLELARTLGFPWTEVSTAFLVDDAAHVGVLDVAARLDGRSVAIAGVHAVGTAPSGRGQGAGRRALERALRHVDERYDTAMLTTEIPAYFEPHGFRVVQEHQFRVRDPLPTGVGRPLRKLDAARSEDAAFVRDALSRRLPHSQRLAVEEEGWFFGIDEVINHHGFGTLYAADDLGVLVAWQRIDGRAQLLDVVASEQVPFAEIAARLPADVTGIDVAFCPDLLDVATDAVPGSPDDTVWMVRGDWPLKGPFVWPLHARC